MNKHNLACFAPKPSERKTKKKGRRKTNDEQKHALNPH